MPILEKKLYQLIISRLNGYAISSPSYREGLFELVRKGIGGFIIFGGRKDEVKDLVSKLQSSSEKPLFIASDIERGVGQQIEGGSHFPSQMAVAAAITAATRQMAEAVVFLSTAEPPMSKTNVPLRMHPIIRTFK